MRSKEHKRRGENDEDEDDEKDAEDREDEYDEEDEKKRQERGNGRELVEPEMQTNQNSHPRNRQQQFNVRCTVRQTDTE